jgi:hypothetical protein
MQTETLAGVETSVGRLACLKNHIVRFFGGDLPFSTDTRLLHGILSNLKRIRYIAQDGQIEFAPGVFVTLGLTR